MQAQQIDVAANTSVTSQLSFASVSVGKSPTGELIAPDGTFKSKNANGHLQKNIPARKFFTSLILIGKDNPKDKAD